METVLKKGRFKQIPNKLSGQWDGGRMVEALILAYLINYLLVRTILLQQGSFGQPAIGSELLGLTR